MIVNIENKKPSLEGGAKDYIQPAIKGLVGAVPFAGAALAEIVGQTLKDYRLERIEEYLIFLEKRI